MSRLATVLLAAMCLAGFARADDLTAKVIVREASAPASGPAVSIALTCNPPTTGVTPTSYNFYRGPASGGPYTLTGSSATCGFTDLTVNWSTTYFYVATSVNGSSSCPAGKTCESNYSSPASATTPASPIPNPPTNLTAGAVVAGSVPLNWKAPRGENVYAYRVYRKRGTGTYAQIASGIKGLTYIDTVPERGTYTYYVKAVVLVDGVKVLSGQSKAAVVKVN